MSKTPYRDRVGWDLPVGALEIEGAETDWGPLEGYGSVPYLEWSLVIQVCTLSLLIQLCSLSGVLAGM